MTNTKSKHLLAVAALLAAALAMMLFYTTQKQGYHVDELYTYELTNYPGSFYALSDGYMDTWHDGSFYAGVLSAGSPADYRIPWNNQKADVHPPLYYCLIYTAELIFPHLGLPWVGLLPNYVCLLAGGVLLYLAARRLTGRFWPAWCEVIGKDLACVHVKDAVFHPDAPRTPTALGAGQMDYTVIREWLHRDHPDAALLRDEVILPAAQADLAYIKAL